MGLVLILLTGLAWGSIGVVLGSSSKRKVDAVTFMAAATLLSCVFSWGLLVDWPVLLAGKVERPVPLIGLLGLAGLAGGLGMLALQKSMTAGAAAWTIGQSAMVIPFLTGILFLGEPMRLTGGLGLTVILLSLLAFARGRPATDSANGPWLSYALGAFLLLGLQQALSSIPSSWEGWSDGAGLRVPIALTAGAVPLVAIVLIRRRPFCKGAWQLAGSYAVLVVTGQSLLFAAMDRLRTTGRLSLAFPLAIGTCILLVALWELFGWKRPPERLTLAGISLGGAGVVLLAL